MLTHASGCALDGADFVEEPTVRGVKLDGRRLDGREPAWEHKS
jgi:hypothetical protein